MNEYDFEETIDIMSRHQKEYKTEWYLKGVMSVFPALALSEEGMDSINQFMKSFEDEEDENEVIPDAAQDESRIEYQRQHNLKVREQLARMSKQKGGGKDGG